MGRAVTPGDRCWQAWGPPPAWGRSARASFERPAPHRPLNNPPAGLAPAVLPPLTPGLAYLLRRRGLRARRPEQARPRTSNTGSGYTTTAGFRLLAPLRGARRESVEGDLRVAYPHCTTCTPGNSRLRQPLEGVIQDIADVDAAPVGRPGGRHRTARRDHRRRPTTCSSMSASPTPPRSCTRCGSPPSGPGVRATPHERVLDTRIIGGKLNAGEERVVTLDGVPGFAHGAVVDLTA